MTSLPPSPRRGRLLLAAPALLAALLLVGCEIVFGDPIDPPPVSNASYRTDYRLDLDGDGEGDRSAICDDRVTELTYSFDYTTELESWTSWLEGGFDGREVGRQTFRPGEDGVRYGNDRVEVTYDIFPGTAPLALPPGGVAPQGIVVVPNPKQIGETILKVRVNGEDFTYTLTSNRIPVIDNCPSN